MAADRVLASRLGAKAAVQLLLEGKEGWQVLKTTQSLITHLICYRKKGIRLITKCTDFLKSCPLKSHFLLIRSLRLNHALSKRSKW
jgi:hypothetical protein